MRFARLQHSAIVVAMICAPVLLSAQANTEGPVSDKAKKAWAEAFESLHRRDTLAALDNFRRADKQDGGRCLACQKNIIKYALELDDWKAAETAAGEMVAEAQGEKDTALAHFELGRILLREGQTKRKDELFDRADKEFTAALASAPNFPQAIYFDGMALARRKQDDAARARFEQFAKMKPEDDPERRRALRYVANMELARARMAPPFAVTTLDGQRITLDDLVGKVVLLDFWATWCGPCREALPHMQKIARRFAGQPLVILSVSLDSDESKWKEFVVKNEMTWPQSRDGSFTGPVARLFGVTAIPHTFTIDADGVLEDEHIGDASVEGKLKKLVARAQQLQPAQP